MSDIFYYFSIAQAVFFLYRLWKSSQEEYGTKEFKLFPLYLFFAVGSLGMMLYLLKPTLS